MPRWLKGAGCLSGFSLSINQSTITLSRSATCLGRNMFSQSQQIFKVGLVLWCALALASCGGGASSGKTGAVGNAGLLNALDASLAASPITKLPEGTDSISMASFWEQQVVNGFSRVGFLKGYAYEDIQNLSFVATANGNTSDGKSTVLLITHPDHSAQTGDTVTFTGVTKDLLGIPFAYLNSTFEITRRDSNAYLITVPYASSRRETIILSANLYYKLKECEGVQTVTQTPAVATSPVTFFDGLEARVAKQTVENSLTNCSPTLKNFTTYKYFAIANPKYGATLTYPFIGQRVEGGDFASLDKTFDLPSGPLKSGQKGSIGTMKFYKTSNKTVLVGTALLSYEIFKYTSNAVFIAMLTLTYNDNNTLVSTMTEVYARDPAVDKDYKLIRTTVKYNNPRRNELVIE